MQRSTAILILYCFIILGVLVCGEVGIYQLSKTPSSTADCDIHDAVVTQLTAERDGWALRWHNTEQALDNCEGRVRECFAALRPSD